MAAVPFTVTPMSDDDERAECLVCKSDFMEQTDPSAYIWQCADGHTLCAACFEAGGGATALCRRCKVPTGSIRNRALEKLRNAHIHRVQARRDPLQAGGEPATGTDAAAGGEKKEKEDKAARESKRENWNFKFNPSNPFDGGGGAPNPSEEGASTGKPTTAGDSFEMEAAKPTIWPKFTYVSPSVFQFGDESAAGGSGSCSDTAAAQQAEGTEPSELFGVRDEGTGTTSDLDGASTASTAPTGASPTSKTSSIAHSVSPEGAQGSSSQSRNELQSPSNVSGSRSASASPMDVDASGSKAASLRRAKAGLAGDRAKVRDRGKTRVKKEAKESDGSADGFVFEVTGMLERIVIQPTGPAHHAGHAESSQRNEAWGAEGMGADVTEQPQGPVNQANASAPQMQAHASKLAFAFDEAKQSCASPKPKTAGARRAEPRSAQKSDKKRGAGKSVGVGGAPAAPFSFDAPPVFPQSTAPIVESAQYFKSSPPESAAAPPQQPTNVQPPFSFNEPASGGFHFSAPQAVPPFGGATDPTKPDMPEFSQTFEADAAPSSDKQTSPHQVRRSTKSTSTKKSPSRPSPSNRPEEEEAKAKGGGGFSFRTPFKTQIPDDFKWGDDAEREAFEKLARMAGATAASRLLEKNPNTPPSKLLARVTMPNPQEKEQQKQKQKQEKDAGGRGSARGDITRSETAAAGPEPISEEDIRERCIQLKDRGNAYFKERRWDAAADTYAKGVGLASKLLSVNYLSATEDERPDMLAALAGITSVLYSNGANALEKLGRRQEALQCCRLALKLKSDNGKAAVRGAQCAVAIGIFAESLPFYRAAIALGFPNLESDLAKAERMSEDMRKATELLAQHNGARAKVCLKDAQAAAPRSVRVLELLVKAHLQCTEFEEARALCKVLMTLVPRRQLSAAAAGNDEQLSHAALSVLHSRALCGLGVVDGVLRLHLLLFLTPHLLRPLLCTFHP